MRGRTDGTTSGGIPSSDELRIPVLAAVRELGGTAAIDEILAKVIAMQGYDPEVTAPIHQGNETKLAYRMAWTRTHLKNDGLLENPARKQWSLTPAGIAALQTGNGRVRPTTHPTAPETPIRPPPRAAAPRAAVPRHGGSSPLALDLPDPACQAKLRGVSARVRQMRARHAGLGGGH
jgi:Mrr N-terminal domain